MFAVVFEVRPVVAQHEVFEPPRCCLADLVGGVVRVPPVAGWHPPWPGGRVAEGQVVVLPLGGDWPAIGT